MRPHRPSSVRGHVIRQGWRKRPPCPDRKYQGSGRSWTLQIGIEEDGGTRPHTKQPRYPHRTVPRRHHPHRRGCCHEELPGLRCPSSTLRSSASLQLTAPHRIARHGLRGCRHARQGACSGGSGPVTDGEGGRDQCSAGSKGGGNAPGEPRTRRLRPLRRSGARSIGPAAPR